MNTYFLIILIIVFIILQIIGIKDQNMQREFYRMAIEWLERQDNDN